MKWEEEGILKYRSCFELSSRGWWCSDDRGRDSMVEAFGRCEDAYLV